MAQNPEIVIGGRGACAILFSCLLGKQVGGVRGENVARNQTDTTSTRRI